MSSSIIMEPPPMSMAIISNSLGLVLLKDHVSWVWNRWEKGTPISNLKP
jgi:hypothetical protein